MSPHFFSVCSIRYETEHFRIYFYPEEQQHLERIAGYAESAYQQVSADLRHELSFKIPLVMFKTHSEFEQQNIAGPEASSEGVGAFAEPSRNRLVLPIDDPPDLLEVGLHLVGSRLLIPSYGCHGSQISNKT